MMRSGSLPGALRRAAGTGWHRGCRNGRRPPSAGGPLRHQPGMLRWLACLAAAPARWLHGQILVVRFERRFRDYGYTLRGLDGDGLI